MLPIDAIRRIQMADKLLDHYTGVLSQVRDAARRRDRAEIDLQVADANRVLDLIWEVLDDACQLVASADRDITLYLRIREQRVGSESDPVAGDGLPRRLSAAIRHRGASLADEASEALKRSIPERDWTGLHSPAPSRAVSWLTSIAERLFVRGRSSDSDRA